MCSFCIWDKLLLITLVRESFQLTLSLHSVVYVVGYLAIHAVSGTRGERRSSREAQQCLYLLTVSVMFTKDAALCTQYFSLVP